MVTYLLTVGDDEVAVGDDDNVLLEVAEEGAHVGVPGNSCGWAMHDLASQVQSTSTLGDRGNEYMT